MPFSGGSALHGVNPNEKKNQKDVKQIALNHAVLQNLDLQIFKVFV